MFNRGLALHLSLLLVGCQSQYEKPDCKTEDTFYCFSYGNYPQVGTLCVIDEDCTAPLGPCEAQVCDDGKCVTRGKGHKQVACGGEDLDLWCNDKDCCGWMSIEPLW
jgi:hypothetical protein